MATFHTSVRAAHYLDLHAHPESGLTSQTAMTGANAKPYWQALAPGAFVTLLATKAKPMCVQPGWYALEIDLHPAGNTTELQPRLYADTGDDYASAYPISLQLMSCAAGLRGVLCFAEQVVGLRLEPASAACEFTLGSIRLVPLTKLRAAARMARTIAARDGNWFQFISRLWHARARLRGFGDWLYATYRGEQNQSRGDYAAWVRQYDRYSHTEYKIMAASARELAYQPTVSIVVPVYETPKKWLIRCVESVRRQVYQNWELCLADDASPSPHIRELLQHYARIDKRIKVVFRERNGHISEASNSALGMASGEWIALLDHDDELPRHALYAVVQAINQHPDVRLLYTDEDKIDTIGQRFDPYFKPDWNYDLFLGQNMLSHFGVYRTDLVLKVGGFRKGFEGSQDYDLALRCIENLRAEQIQHIPRILYHWRAIPGSTAISTGEKSYAAAAGQRAIQEHLRRTGQTHATVEIHKHGYRVRRPMVKTVPLPKVSLIIPTRDRVDLLRMCIESILTRTTYTDYEVVIVDNQSSDRAALEYLEELANRAKVRVLHYDNVFNFSAINNYAVRHSDGDIIGLLNNDIEVIQGDWLDEMVGHAIRPEVGAVGAMLYYPNNTIQHAGVLLGVGGIAAHAYCTAPRGYPGQMSRARLTQAMSVVTAACLILRREVFNAVGGLDEQLKVAFNDVDFCLRVGKAGYRNIWTPYAELYHYESASRGHEDTPEKQRRFESEVRFMMQRWGDALEQDPAYNPNLSLTTAPFDLAFPPRTPRLR